MIHLSSWHAIKTFETLISYSGELHVSSLLSDFNTLKFSIMEIVRIIDILNFSWIRSILKFSMIFFVECSFLFSGVLVYSRLLNSSFKIRIDSFRWGFCETFAIEIFTSNLRNESWVTWHMLWFKAISRPTNPCLTSFRVVTELLIFAIKLSQKYLITYLSWTGLCLLSK